MQGKPSATTREPLFNLPAIVTATILLLVAIHLVRALLLSPSFDFELLLDYAVVPARWTAAWDPSQTGAILREAAEDLPAREAALRQALAQYVLSEGRARPWTALTYALLHGSWPHLLLNGVWLAAFGTPVARRCGAWRFLLIGALCAIGGAVAHALVHPLSVAPMIGASAAVSGWMAVAACFVFAPHRPGGLGLGGVPEAHEHPRQSLAQLVRNRSAAMFLVIWFATNLVSGLVAAPFGITESSIAWEAHLGGFLVGFLLFPVVDRNPISSP
jgi:membrane associated rhomboid family serine protease